jgi:hypothetical protein
MKNKLITIPLIIIGIAIVLSVAWSASQKSPSDTTPVQTDTNTSTTTPEKTVAMCYYRSDKTSRGLYDRAWLTLAVTGTNVTGEFRNLPAETDSKVGTFTGTIAKDPNGTDTIASVWWNSMAEGMNNTEELQLKYNDTKAQALFAEMVDRGDGVYVYKDKTKGVYTPSMSVINCDSLTELLSVEKFIRDNIQTIATNKPTLGGTWEVRQVVVDPQTHTATISYEDGHIQSQGKVDYTFDLASKNTTVTKFNVTK